MSKKIKIIVLIICTGLVLSLGCFLYFTSPVNSSNTELKIIKVEESEMPNDVIEKLSSNGLLRSVTFTKVYIKLTNKSNFKQGVYNFAQSDSLSKIIDTLNTGSNVEAVNITFREGLRVIDYAKIASENLKVKEKDFLEAANDEAFIDELKKKYELVKNFEFNSKEIYQLEGLLAPNTYNFKMTDSAKDVIEVLVAESNRLYLENRNLYSKSKLSLNEIYSLASIVEAEANNYEDRKEVASIFLNRIDEDISLGSDVTTYYGLQLDLAKRDLTNAELAEENGYNTRSNMKGLPIGPINSPSLESIKAVLNHNNSDNLYFVSDKNVKIYAAKTYDEHNKIIEDLKSKNLWFTY